MTSPFVVVRQINDQRTKGVVDAICRTSDAAHHHVERDQSSLLEAHRWPHSFSPRVGDRVAISGSQICREGRPGFWGRVFDLANDDRNMKLQLENSALWAERELKKPLVEAREAKVNHRLEFTPDGQERFIVTKDNESLALEQLVSDFVEMHRYTYGRVILAPDESTTRKINMMLSLRLGAERRSDGSDTLVHRNELLQTGDRVQFRRDYDVEGVRDGELAEIIYVDKKTRTMFFARDRDQEMFSLSLSEFPHVQLAHATTYERANGLNPSEIVFLADPKQDSSRVVESLHTPRIAIYADKFTAARDFSQLLHAPKQPSPDRDSKRDVDPIAEYCRTR